MTTSLFQAIEDNNLGLVIELLSKGQDPNITEENGGWTPLQCAVEVECVGLPTCFDGNGNLGAGFAAPIGMRGVRDITVRNNTFTGAFRGMLVDCRHHDISLGSAYVILENDRKDLLVETTLRPDAAHSPPFTIEFPTDLDGNYSLLVEIEFAGPVEPDSKQKLLDELALWDDLSFAYPEDPDEQAQVSGGQGHFNDPRTIHHNEWVWTAANPTAWNRLVNLCCAWNRRLSVVRLHIE